MGEEGHIIKIVDCVSDLFHLDALERIGTASTVEIVLNEMRQYPHDSFIGFAGAEALHRIDNMIVKAFIDALPDIHLDFGVVIKAAVSARESFS